MYGRHGVRDERSVMPSRKFSRPGTRAVNNSQRHLQCKTRPASRLSRGGAVMKNPEKSALYGAELVEMNGRRTGSRSTSGKHNYMPK